MDKMIQCDNIHSANLSRLSEGFKKLGTQLDRLAAVADVVKSTSEYANTPEEASPELDTMKNAYRGAANTLGHFNAAADSTKHFHEHVQVLTKNLGSLNSIY